MPTDKKLNNLIINYLTEEQYKSATKNEDELYLTPDVGGNEIETIDGTWDGDDFTLSKTPTSFPFMARLTMAGTNNIAEVYFSDAFSSSEENIKIGLYNDAQSMYVFLYYPEDTSKNAVIQHPYIQGTNVADKVLVSKADKSAKWQFLKTINSQSLLGEGNIDIGGTDIEVINATMTSATNGTLEKAITKLPTIVNIIIEGSEIISIMVTSKMNISSNGSYYFGGSIGTTASGENNAEFRLFIVGTSVTMHRFTPLLTPTESGVVPVCDNEGNVVWSSYQTKQDKLVSGTNIKTINGNSILGSGDLTIKASNEATALTNEDLNDLTTDGASYYAGGSNTVTNKPTGIDAFGLVVRRTASGYYAQYLTGANQSVNSIYVRTYKSGAWTAWERVIVTEGGTSVSIDELHTKIMSVGAIEFEPASEDGDFIQTLQAKTGTIALLDDLDACQKKTYLHTITAIGATLSISFTYPSANNLVVDSAQDASTVIKPTANEYFPAPVVVIATNKLSDACNCVYYNGTIWKFAMWNGTEFTNAEVVTAWQDSVVAVD